MGTLTGSLNIALSALMADQAAVEVTSNNIANANTPGYSRQRPVFVEQPSVTFGNLQFGLGTELQSIQRVTDPILELQIDHETQNQSQLNAFIGAMNQVNALFNETQGAGLQSAITQFFNSFQELSTNPTSTVMRQAVLNAGQNLSIAFNQASNTLTQIKGSLDQSVNQVVGQINDLTSRIATLDNQIGTVPSTQSGNQLQDERNQLINQLSGLIGVSVINVNSGSLTITTANGAPLVVGNQSYALTTQPDPTTGSEQVYDQGSNITTGIQGGQLGGVIEARDHGVTPAQSQLDNLAASIMQAVNTQHQLGYDLSGAPGGQFFAPFTPTQPSTNDGAAAQMAVAITDPTQIAASSSGSSPGDNGNALALAAVQNQPIINNQTAGAFYSGFIGSLGDQVSNATNQQQTSNLILQQLQNQRANISSVSMDEEAANLVKYQLAYEASARVIATVDAMNQTTMNLVNGG